MPTFTTPINIVLEVLATTIRQNKQKQQQQKASTRNARSNIVFADGMILYNPKDSTKKLLELT